MKLEKVSDTDRELLAMRGKWITLAVEFLNSDEDMAEIKGITGDVENTYRNLKSAIRRRKMPITVMRRKDRLFLVRSE